MYSLNVPAAGHAQQHVLVTSCPIRLLAPHSATMRPATASAPVIRMGSSSPASAVSLLYGGMGSEDWRMNDGDEVLISLVALVVCTVLLIYFFVYF